MILGILHNVSSSVTIALIWSSQILLLQAFSSIAAFGIATSIINSSIDVSNPVNFLSVATHQLTSSMKPTTVRFFDLKDGNGDVKVDEGRTVQFLWSLRRSNGYFVDSSSNYDNEPFIYKVGNSKNVKVVEGIDQGIRGMKVGGVRRIEVPSNLAYIEGVGDGKPGPMPADYGPRRQILSHSDSEAWNFEIKLVKIK